jgi:hypothetical protein
MGEWENHLRNYPDRPSPEHQLLLRQWEMGEITDRQFYWLIGESDADDEDDANVEKTHKRPRGQHRPGWHKF